MSQEHFTPAVGDEHAEDIDRAVNRYVKSTKPANDECDEAQVSSPESDGSKFLLTHCDMCRQGNMYACVLVYHL